MFASAALPLLIFLFVIVMVDMNMHLCSIREELFALSKKATDYTSKLTEDDTFFSPLCFTFVKLVWGN